MPSTKQEYDYIIVGAGSAGCALAYRLSREASRKVLLLEAGGRDTQPMIHMPLGFAFLMKNAKVNWLYETEPEANMHNRKVAWPRGKVLGGCSSINGMVYIRGQREDYDHWHSLGNTGWSYDEVLPYFKRSEHRAEGANNYHGYGGPLWVQEVANEDKMEMADLFVEACVQTGLPFNEDFNGDDQEGAGYYQLNIKRGLRQSAARTFLKQCEHRPNLTLEIGALTERILLEDGRAVGVEYSKTKGGKTTKETAYTRGEVILCGGVINSPQLLELSGIGASDRLSKLGIPVAKDLPGVGENLQDHLTINVIQGLQGTNTFYEESRPLALLKNIAKFFTQRRGLLTHPASQVGVFFRTNDKDTLPDAQVHFAPAAGEYDKRGNLKTVAGTTATVCHLKPESRGSVHIKSANPADAPAIQANYLNTDSDRAAMIAAVRKVRDMFAAPALDRYRKDELQPGSTAQSDEEILSFIRANGESVYHPVGTCKMGNDELAVVDDRLRVHGIEGLRVADASIMPRVPAGNTHAPTVMIAEKCADMVLQDAGVKVHAPQAEAKAQKKATRRKAETATAQ